MQMCGIWQWWCKHHGRVSWWSSNKIKKSKLASLHLWPFNTHQERRHSTSCGWLHHGARKRKNPKILNPVAAWSRSRGDVASRACRKPVRLKETYYRQRFMILGPKLDSSQCCIWISIGFRSLIYIIQK